LFSWPYAQWHLLSENSHVTWAFVPFFVYWKTMILDLNPFSQTPYNCIIDSTNFDQFKKLIKIIVIGSFHKLNNNYFYKFIYNNKFPYIVIFLLFIHFHKSKICNFTQLLLHQFILILFEHKNKFLYNF